MSPTKGCFPAELTYSVTVTNFTTCALQHRMFRTNRPTSVFVDWRIYPHTPILRPHAARHVLGSQRVIVVNVVEVVARAGRFVRFWASGGAKFRKWEIPCLGRWWTAVQNLNPLASSSAKKFVTVQTNKYVRLRGRSYIHTCRFYTHARVARAMAAQRSYVR